MFSSFSNSKNNNIVYGGVNSLSLKTFNKSTSDVSREDFDTLRKKIENLENRDANIRTLINDIVVEQLKTYIIENEIKNEFLSSKNEVQFIEEEQVRSTIKSIGVLASQTFEVDHPHLFLIRYEQNLLLLCY